MSTDPKKEVYEYRNCTSCQKKFFISMAEKDYYGSAFDEKTGKPYVLPKRCYACRMEQRKPDNHGQN
jgi:hypothetical protein